MLTFHREKCRIVNSRKLVCHFSLQDVPIDRTSTLTITEEQGRIEVASTKIDSANMDIELTLKPNVELVDCDTFTARVDTPEAETSFELPRPLLLGNLCDVLSRKQPPRKDLFIAMFGMAGGGKSSTINSASTLCDPDPLSTLVDRIAHAQDTGNHTTVKVKVHKVKLPNNVTLNLIDLPGFRPNEPNHPFACAECFDVMLKHGIPEIDLAHLNDAQHTRHTHLTAGEYTFNYRPDAWLMFIPLDVTQEDLKPFQQQMRSHFREIRRLTHAMPVIVISKCDLDRDSSPKRLREIANIDAPIVAGRAYLEHDTIRDPAIDRVTARMLHRVLLQTVVNRTQPPTWRTEFWKNWPKSHYCFEIVMFVFVAAFLVLVAIVLAAPHRAQI